MISTITVDLPAPVAAWVPWAASALWIGTLALLLRRPIIRRRRHNRWQ